MNNHASIKRTRSYRRFVYDIPFEEYGDADTQLPPTTPVKKKAKNDPSRLPPRQRLNVDLPARVIVTLMQGGRVTRRVRLNVTSKELPEWESYIDDHLPKNEKEKDRINSA